MLQSAAMLIYRRTGSGPEFLLAHPGGPFWSRRDEGAWSIPKGLIGEGEPPLAAAMREFEEEVGLPLAGRPEALTPRRVSPRKLVYSWMLEADLDPAAARSNTIELEWPPRSGRRAVFPEVDRVAYFDGATALRKIVPGQAPVIEEAIERIGEGRRP